mmetsp:Transcript_33219/g.50102  ORF Transcript_33219/g.50102 Transcript_33219/m.50102 type:complete len:251 (+) Transcript_33219:184-936(+)
MAEDCDCGITFAKIFRQFGFPVLLGLVTSVVASYVAWIRDRQEKRMAMLDKEMNSASELCYSIIDGSDALQSALANYAWHIAKRRHVVKDEDMLQVDVKYWNDYQKLLKSFRAENLSNKTELKAVFGKGGYEVLLFEEMTNIYEKAADMVWAVYYSNSTKVSEQEYFTEMALLKRATYKLSEAMILNMQNVCLKEGSHGTTAIPKNHEAERAEIMEAETALPPTYYGKVNRDLPVSYVSYNNTSKSEMSV